MKSNNNNDDDGFELDLSSLEPPNINMKKIKRVGIDMKYGIIIRNAEEDNFGNFDFGEDGLDIGKLKYQKPQIKKKVSFDEIIEDAIKEKKLHVFVEYLFEKGDKETAHELYYKYFSNLRIKNKDKLERIGRLAEDIELHYEAFKKFVRTNEYYKAIYSAKKANMNIPVKYIRLAVDYYIERLGNAPGLRDVAEVIGSDLNEDTKELFLNAIDHLEKKDEYSIAADIASHIAEYNIALKNYIRIKHFWKAAKAAKKAGLEKESKEYYKQVMERYLRLGRMNFLTAAVEEAKEAWGDEWDLEAVEREAREFFKK